MRPRPLRPNMGRARKNANFGISRSQVRGERRGLRPQRQVRGVRGVAARHDCQRVGLAQQHQGGLQQDLDQSQSHQLR